MKLSSTLSKISSVISVVPKPPLSLLRLGGAVGTGPIGAGLIVGSVVGIKAFEHRGEIKTTLGNIVSGIKSAGNKIISTTDKINPKKSEEDEGSMLIPLLLLGGCSLVVIFVVMRK